MEIDNLITADEMYQLYNIDLESYLGLEKQQTNNTTVVKNYIADKQDLIFRYVAKFRYQGMGDIPFLLSCSEYLSTIKKAIRLQIKFEVLSGTDLTVASRIYMDSNKIMTIEKGLIEEEMVAREARDALHSCIGLLYSGGGSRYI